MTSKIISVANLAFQVFSGVQSHSSRATRAMSRDQLSRLMSLLNTLTPQDVGFDPRWLSDAGTYHAPVVYVHITENEVFSMGIFVLRPGSRIPLHDHPNMNGIVKVIHGSVRCRSYSRAEAKLPVVGELLPLSRWQLSDLVVARPHQDLVLSTQSEACLLTPTEGNLHELFPVNGGAAFLDILAPPYDHDLGTRECHFYREVSLPQKELRLPNGQQQLDTTEEVQLSQHQRANGSGDSGQTVVYFVETPRPKDYWCDSAEYKGPRVS